MKTTRLLLGLTATLTILAIPTTPASAVFQANQANTAQGPAQIIGSAPTLENGAASVKCATLKNGEWHIQTKFTKITKDPNGFTKIQQDLTKDGEHEAFSGLFETCVAEPGSIPAEVNSTCQLQIVQLSRTLGLGVVKSRCRINIPAAKCEIDIEAGNPNTNLPKVELNNIPVGLEAKSEVKGITTTVAGAGCEPNGIKGTNEGKFKATIQAHSQKVI